MKLYFGCGRHKVEGFIGVDKIQTGHVDVVHDMNVCPYPFADNAVDEVLLINILKHFQDIIRVLEEIWRICNDPPGVFVPPPLLAFSLLTRPANVGQMRSEDLACA